METSSLIIGIFIGILGAFGTGFLKKAGEDSYHWIKKKISPNSISENKPQVVIQLNHDGNEKIDQLSTTNIKRITPLTFDEISNSIELAPLLQRQEIAKKYVGLIIEWDTYLRSAYQRENGDISLRLSVDPDYKGRSVICIVQGDQYREIGILKEGAKIRVSGEIIEANTFDIELNNAVLEILSF